MSSIEFSNDIKCLNISSKVINRLNKNNIYTIEELWSLNRKDLKNIGIVDQEINQIIIRLQLEGLDLNKKVFKF